MIIGIDPGLSGGIAVCGHDGRLRSATNIPTVLIGTKMRIDVNALITVLLPWRSDDAAVYLEFVSSMPRQGVASAFNFGRTFGEIHGVVAALRFRVHLVPSQVWKFQMGLRAKEDTTVKTRKTASLLQAKRLFPEHAHLFERVKDDGRAEAALIAHYGALQEMRS